MKVVIINSDILIKGLSGHMAGRSKIKMTVENFKILFCHFTCPPYAVKVIKPNFDIHTSYCYCSAYGE